MREAACTIRRRARARREQRRDAGVAQISSGAASAVPARTTLRGGTTSPSARCRCAASPAATRGSTRTCRRWRAHERPAARAPVTVHFTFQFGDTNDYPHGKRQRAREAALWAVDPPEYFTEGVFVALVGPTYTPAQEEATCRSASRSGRRSGTCSWTRRSGGGARSARRWRRRSTASSILPKLHCHCDRYWGFLSRCRIPMVQGRCRCRSAARMDALYDTQRWNKKGVKLPRAHLPRQRMCHVPGHAHRAGKGKPVKANTVRVVAAGAAAAAAPQPRRGRRRRCAPGDEHRRAAVRGRR